MPPHGAANWHGTLDLPPHSEARSVLSDEKLNPVVTVGSVILPDPMNSALNPGRTGMVVSIDPDENGEPVYTVLRTRKIRNRDEAWTFTMPASEVKPECVVPDDTIRRHGFALSALRAACDGRFVSVEGLKLIGLAVALVRDCLAGPSVSKS